MNHHPEPERVRLRLLHTPAWFGPAGNAVLLGSADAAVLAWLALHGETQRSKLAELLWPDRAPEIALGNLRQHVYRLQRASAYRLLRSETTLALGPAVEHDLVDPLEALRTDPQALQGALLGEFDFGSSKKLSSWVEAERERWRSRVRDALLALASEHDAQCRLGEAFAYAARLAADEPLLEKGARLLMHLHHRRGDRGAALAVYERCVRALHDEHGESPSDETVALAQGISRGEVPGVRAVARLPQPLRHPPFTVGREEAMAAAARSWEARGVVLLTGPSGIGKSRVLDDLVAGWGIPIVCRLKPEDASADLGLVRQLACALLVQLPGGMGNHHDDAALRWFAGQATTAVDVPAAPDVDGAAALLEAALAEAGRQRPLALAIDDLQWADPDSQAVLARLLPASGGTSSRRWLLASRDRSFTGPLAEWLARQAMRHDPQLELAPLDAQQTATLLATLVPEGIDVARWAAALHAHCGGHPQSMLQVLRGLHDRDALRAPAPPAQLPMPRDALHTLLRTLETSDAPTHQLAFIAALAGADFDATLACRLLGRSASETAVYWRRLESLGVLRGTEFSHHLMRQAVLESVPQALAPAMRRDIAQALAGVPRAAARRADHWEAAGEWGEAAADRVLAANEALELGLKGKGRDLLMLAATSFDRVTNAEGAFDARCRAAMLTLVCDSAADALLQAEQLLSVATTEPRRCQALTLLSIVRAEQHDVRSETDARAATQTARRLGDLALLARAELAEARALMLVGRHDESLALLTRLREPGTALTRAERVQATEAAATALDWLGRRNESIALTLAARDEALARNDLRGAADHACDAALKLCYLGHTGQAIEMMRGGLEQARQAGVASTHGFGLIDEMNLAGLLQDGGRFAEALDIFERVTPQLRAAGFETWAMNAENSLCGLFRHLGRPDLARRQVPEAALDVPLWARAARRATRALLRAVSGEPPLVELQAARAMLDESGALLNPYTRHRIDAEIARWSDPAVALQRAEECRAWCVANQHRALARYAAFVATDALLRAGDAPAAAGHADALAADFGGDWQAYNFYLPEIWWTLVRAWDGVGRRDDADTLARHAAGWLQARNRDDVPEVFSRTFLQVNPANQRLLRRVKAAR